GAWPHAWAPGTVRQTGEDRARTALGRFVSLPGGANAGPRPDLRRQCGPDAADENGDRRIPEEERRTTLDPARLHGERAAEKESGVLRLTDQFTSLEIGRGARSDRRSQ